MASPYPTGTFARQEAPSFAWRTNARVRLFGSRLDNERRGGDFDFYVETDLDDPAQIIERKLRMLAHLRATPEFEDEKIDLIIHPALPGPYPAIYERARRQGLLL